MVRERIRMMTVLIRRCSYRFTCRPAGVNDRGERGAGLLIHFFVMETRNLPGLGPIRPHSNQYETYMKSAEWKEKAETIKVLAGHRCACCGRQLQNSSSLQAHHYSYRCLGQERKEDLLVLCDECHLRFHHIRAGEIKEIIALLRRVNGTHWTKEYLSQEQEILTEIIATAIIKATAGNTGQCYSRAVAYFGIYQINDILPVPLQNMLKRFKKGLERYRLPSPGSTYQRRAKELRNQ